MDAETLSRIQFAGTASFHFIYPPLSMGLGIMLVFFGIAYVRTKDAKWRQLAFFWTQVYGLIFAMGVATGIVQEFEFGMNWSAYSRFVGNVFGSLLAAEGVFAFFLEGGFLGLMLFGGSRLGPRMWLGATCVVVFAAHFSALWIIMAHSWMQTPDGYKLVTEGGVQEAQMTNFLDVMFTPSFIQHILHVWAASWTAGAALVLSVSSYYILRNRHQDLAQAAFKIAMPFFALMAVLNLVLFGAQMAIEVTDNQPLKAGGDGGCLGGRFVRASLHRRLGERIQPDNNGHQRALPAQLPRLPGLRRHGPGPGLVPGGHAGRRSTSRSRSTTACSTWRWSSPRSA